MVRRKNYSKTGTFEERLREFLAEENFTRYQKLLKHDFVEERRVVLFPGEHEDFQREIRRRHWGRLASLPESFNPNIVREFYANAYSSDPSTTHKESYVRGTRIRYDKDIIRSYLNDPIELDENGLCKFQRMRSECANSSLGFKDRRVIDKLCFRRGLSLDKNKQIKRAYMTTITQIWTSFLWSNISPSTHTSDLTLPNAYIIYSILKRYSIDIATIISEKIYKAVTSENRITLIFPSLITDLCRYQGAYVPDQPQSEIRQPITAAFIGAHCITRTKEAVGEDEPAEIPRLRPPSPLPDINGLESEPSLRGIKRQLDRIEANQEHLFMQQAANYRATTITYSHYSKAAVDSRSPYAWPTLEDIEHHTKWPGDRPAYQQGKSSSRAAGDDDGDADGGRPH